MNLLPRGRRVLLGSGSGEPDEKKSIKIMDGFRRCMAGKGVSYGMRLLRHVKGNLETD